MSIALLAVLVLGAAAYAADRRYTVRVVPEASIGDRSRIHAGQPANVFLLDRVGGKRRFELCWTPPPSEPPPPGQRPGCVRGLTNGFAKTIVPAKQGRNKLAFTLEDTGEVIVHYVQVSPAAPRAKSCGRFEVRGRGGAIVASGTGLSCGRARAVMRAYLRGERYTGVVQVEGWTCERGLDKPHFVGLLASCRRSSSTGFDKLIDLNGKRPLPRR